MAERAVVWSAWGEKLKQFSSVAGWVAAGLELAWALVKHWAEGEVLRIAGEQRDATMAVLTWIAQTGVLPILAIPAMTLAVLLLATWIITVRANRQSTAPALPSDALAAAPAAIVAAAPSEPPALVPHQVRSEIAGVSFGGLWKKQKSVAFSVNVRSLAPLPVHLTGVEGYILVRVQGQDEKLPAPRLTQKDLPLSSPTVGDTAVIEHDLDGDLARALKAALVVDDGRVPFKFFLTWKGRYGAAGDGSVDESKIWLPQENFYVVAPIRRGDIEKEVVRFSTSLGSSDWYTSDGAPKYHVVLPRLEVRVNPPSHAEVTPGRASDISAHLYITLINHGDEQGVLEWCRYVIREADEVGGAKLLSLPLLTLEGKEVVNVTVAPRSSVEPFELVARGNSGNVAVPHAIDDAIEYKIAGRAAPIELPLK